MKTIIILLLTLISCKQPTYVNVRNINPEFIDIVELIEEDLGITVDYEIEFSTTGELDSKTLGVCSKEHNGKKSVQINIDTWDNLNDSIREILLIHEIGHCTLDIEHTHEDKVDLGAPIDCPSDLMVKYMFNSFLAEVCYENNRDYYLDMMINLSN